jgi:hypothetical protein
VLAFIHVSYMLTVFIYIYIYIYIFVYIMYLQETHLQNFCSTFKIQTSDGGELKSRKHVTYLLFFNYFVIQVVFNWILYFLFN